MKVGAIEAGGTKFVLAIGDENGNVLEKVSIPTTTPEETFEGIYQFFDGKEFESIGVGTFGPIDLNPLSPTYGYITKTPKPGWSDCEFVGRLERRYHVPVAFDTDVNGAALGEVTYGAAKGINSCIYLTIGTGIGGGAIVEGKLVHGMLHPEMGHIKLIPHPKETYKGCCPFHDYCFEGLASGPAIEKRFNEKAYNLPKDHEAWAMEGYYIGQALCNYILTLSPQKIILGGGVMHQTQVFPYIYSTVRETLNGYVQTKEILEDIENYIVLPGCGDEAGIKGAIALALQVL